MSNKYIESVVGDEGSILIEVGDSGGAVGFGAAIEKTKAQAEGGDAFEQALKAIHLAADSVLNTLNSLSERPDTARIDFSIKFDAEARAMIASSVNDGQLRVSLGWNTAKPEEEKDSKAKK